MILVNSGRRRSDAIIVTAEDDPVHVPLPDATVADVASRAMAWLQAVHDNSPAAILLRRRTVPETLGWLWDVIVQPALNAVPRTADGKSALRRVWWLPTGLLGLFPLHAAGHPGQARRGPRAGQAHPGPDPGPDAPVRGEGFRPTGLASACLDMRHCGP